MARRRKPEGETEEEAVIRHTIEVVSGSATRNEKVSWNRKMDSMQTLVDKIRPIEDQISDLLVLKQPILDEIAALRLEMIKDCVHPFQYILHKDDHVLCKFCNKKFVINDME